MSSKVKHQTYQSIIHSNFDSFGQSISNAHFVLSSIQSLSALSARVSPFTIQGIFCLFLISFIELLSQKKTQEYSYHCLS